MAKIAVVGSINLDYVVSAPHIPAPGQTVHGENLSLFPGGKGANQAVAAARLGAQVAMIGRVGADAAGEKMLAALKGEGIDTSAVSIDPQQSTGTAFITIDKQGENAIVVAPGANMQVTPEAIRQNEPLLAAADIIICQLEIPVETIYFLIRTATVLGKRVVFNPAPAHAFDLSVLKVNDVITPNEHEAALLAGMPIKTPADAGKAANELATNGPFHIAVTLGGQGVWLKSGDQERLIPARKVKVVDATAAGDTFTGALGVALAQGMDMYAAAEFARDAAAITVTRLGAHPSMPTWAEVEAFRKSQGATN